MKKSSTPELLGSIIESVLSERGYLAPCRELGVVQAWPLLVGEKLSKATECTRVDNGVLYVRVASSPWRQELSFMKQCLLEKIKRETHCMTIKDIVFY